MDRYDKIIFDFDDTIWSRNSKDIECSIYNSKFISDHLKEKSIIISGNSYESINEKLGKYNIVFPVIWADANSVEYINGEFNRFIPKSIIDLESVEKIYNFIKREWRITPQLVGPKNNYITNIKIKPIRFESNRDYICDTLNNFVFDILDINDCVARKTGKTTIDILTVYNSKELVYNNINLDRYKTLFIGDEVDFGNDKCIADLCTDKIKVSSVYDTKKILEELV